jgi:hypothetical protein
VRERRRMWRERESCRPFSSQGPVCLRLRPRPRLIAPPPSYSAPSAHPNQLILAWDAQLPSADCSRSILDFALRVVSSSPRHPAINRSWGMTSRVFPSCSHTIHRFPTRLCWLQPSSSLPPPPQEASPLFTLPPLSRERSLRTPAPQISTNSPRAAPIYHKQQTHRSSINPALSISP